MLIFEDIFINKRILETLHHAENRKNVEKNYFLIAKGVVLRCKCVAEKLTILQQNLLKNDEFINNVIFKNFQNDIKHHSKLKTEDLTNILTLKLKNIQKCTKM